MKIPPFPGAWYPTDKELEDADSIVGAIVKGCVPRRPIIDKQSSIVAFGSCFAAYVSIYLKDAGYNVETRKNDNMAYIAAMGDAFVNTPSILQQFEWAWLGNKPTVDLWYNYDGSELGYREDVRRETKRLLDLTDVFIITLGLSEIWYDEPTGQIFWRMVPSKNIDPSRHKFRVLTHAETVSDLKAIASLIRIHRPEARIVFTVSPVPLKRTFRTVSSTVANEASKAIIRSAVDEFMREVNDKLVFYFPSYEIGRNLFYRPYIHDRRHINVYIINFIMSVFDYYFCGGITKAELVKRYRDARDRDVRWVNGERFYD